MEMEIIEGNNLIAEFMGVQLTDTLELDAINLINGQPVIVGERSVLMRECKYHSSWTQLMPVVEKIEEIGYDFNIFRWTVTVFEKHNPDDAKFGISSSSKMAAVYKSVVQFIKWYNLNGAVSY